MSASTLRNSAYCGLFRVALLCQPATRVAYAVCTVHSRAPSRASTPHTMKQDDAAAARGNVRGRYDVYVIHAGAQKDFAVLVRRDARVSGYRAFVDDRDLWCGPACHCNPMMGS